MVICTPDDFLLSYSSQPPKLYNFSTIYFFYYQYYTITKTCYSTILKILPPKDENVQIKTSDILHMSAQNIDCGYSLEPHHRVPTIYVIEQK